MPVGLVQVFISAWASALLVLTERAMPEPWSGGTGIRQVPTLFSFVPFPSMMIYLQPYREREAK